MRIKRYLRSMLTGVGLGLLVLNMASVGASSANISRAYPVNTPIRPGSIVVLDEAGSVTPANSSTKGRPLGVAVASNDSLIAINAAHDSVQVATSSSASVLVSTLNGDVHAGDLVGVSPFNGIGMKALPGSNIIGTAQADFTSATPGGKEQQIQNKNGKSTSVRVGYIRVNIEPGTAPAAADPNILQKLIKELTGRTVDPAAAVLLLILIIIALLILFSFMFAFLLRRE